MCMSDRQYDGMLLEFLEDLDDIVDVITEAIPDGPEKDKILKVIQKKIKKTERKFENPVRPHADE